MTQKWSDRPHTNRLVLRSIPSSRFFRFFFFFLVAVYDQRRHARPARTSTRTLTLTLTLTRTRTRPLRGDSCWDAVACGCRPLAGMTPDP